MDSCYPVYVPVDFLFPYRVKIVQVAASFRASYFLTESRLILCSGTTGEFKMENYVIKFNLRLKVKSHKNRHQKLQMKTVTLP